VTASANPATFERCGLAALDDLETQEWRRLIRELEAIQAEFLAAGPYPLNYIWPKDPLHTWGRVWEYRYVFHHVRKWRSHWSGARTPLALDFGSGVTFFPFAVAREGFHVICVDNDPACEEGILRARDRVDHEPGNVSFRLTDGTRLPVESGSIDVLYSISVLEHLPDPAAVVEEFARVLAPGGVLLLTFDIALEPAGPLGLNPKQRNTLLSRLSDHFEMIYPHEFVHPAAMLTSSRGPYPMHQKKHGLCAVWQVTRDELLKPLLRRPPSIILRLACEACTCGRLPAARHTTSYIESVPSLQDGSNRS